jgi:hypothetical protein
MTTARLVLIAALAATATVASAQPRMPGNSGPPATAQIFVPDRPIDHHDQQCFNGKFLSGANRIGDKVVLLQSARSDVFRVELKQPCPAIEAARRLRVRSEGSDKVCDGGRAEIVATTSAGVQRCSVDEVRALTDREVATLSAAPRR